tara:strand:+ start:140 stop:379 length:240 start_codon:yes stop_codon:yes gene_type:complete
MSNVDAVITSLELQLETPNNPFGSFVAFRFIDTYPSFPKVQEMVSQIKKRSDVSLVDYEYTYTGINENTDIKFLEVTRH